MISAAVIEALKEIVPADKVLLQEPMKLHTTFRIGGPADCLVYLENEEQLCKIQKYLRLVDVPYTVIGNGICWSATRDMQELSWWLVSI